MRYCPRLSTGLPDDVYTAGITTTRRYRSLARGRLLLGLAAAACEFGLGQFFAIYFLHSQLPELDGFKVKREAMYCGVAREYSMEILRVLVMTNSMSCQLSGDYQLYLSRIWRLASSDSMNSSERHGEKCSRNFAGELIFRK